LEGREREEKEKGRGIPKVGSHSSMFEILKML